MNNLSIKIKKLLSNKNVVTALCFILIAVVLILGYNYRISEATKPVTIVYANQTIKSQTKITEEMLEEKTIASNSFNSELMFTSKEQVVGKYVNIDSTVYQGTIVYKSSVTEKDSLPTSAILDVEEGQTLLTLSVDMKKTYYNSIIPGDYVDLYVRTIGALDSKDNEIIAGKLLSGIKVLAVKDESGNNVFGGEETTTPSGILFAVPDDIALLIMKADYFSKLSEKVDSIETIEFVLVPKGQAYEDPAGTESTVNLSSEKLEKYIKERTAEIDIKDIQKNTKIGE